MSRKAAYGFDYDDYYDDYGDYEYDEEEEKEEENGLYEEHGEVPVVNQEAVKPGVWRCSICTYDNDENMTYCEICGVLHFPPCYSGSNTEKNSVGGMCKDFGVSKLAKSLFASVPRRIPQMVIASQPQNWSSLTGEDYNNIKNIQQHSRVFSDGLSAPRSSRIPTIVPFKFDVPSPDDAISSRLNSVNKGASRGFSAVNTASAAQSSVRQVNSSIESKGKNSAEDHSITSTSNLSRNINIDEVVEVPSSSSRFNNATKNLKPKPNNIRDSSSLADGAESKSLASDLDKVSMNSKPESSKSVIPRKAISHYQPEKWMIPDKDSVKDHLNLAIVGHVDSGKSTLTGRLLNLLGQISQKQMHKYEKDAKQQGKGSFAYAWALDESTEERERGVTMNVAVNYFDTNKYHVVVLDSPGHRDFVPNLISGAIQADTAILVIDASTGAYETGMDSTAGQSREHAQLIRSFGVDQIVVAVNKMDVVEYSKERFELIKNQVGSFLRQCGFKEYLILWVPLSVMENQNVVAAASDVRLSSWYKGPNLLDAIDLLRPPKRDYEKPVLMPICDVVKTQSMAQVSVCGKLEAGALRSGCKVLVMPLGDTATVRSIESNSQPCAIARAGESVAVALQGIDVSYVSAGWVLCHPDYPVRVASHLELKILVLDVKVPIFVNYQLEFHIHHAKEVAKVTKIVSVLDPKTGKEKKSAPRCLIAKQSAVIQVSLQGPVCVEDFSSCKALGRVFLRSSGKTIAVGVVTQVLEDQN